MAQLALKAVSWGAEKIPDRAFHKIPGGYFRPPEVERERQEKRKQRKEKKRLRKEMGEKPENGDGEKGKESSNDASNDTSNDSGDDGDEEEEAVGTKEPKQSTDSKARRRERPRRSRNSSYIDRGYESDRGPRDENYFPPPPVQAVTSPPVQPVAEANPSSPRQSATPTASAPAYKPYNPADYPGPPTQEERERELAARLKQTRIGGNLPGDRADSRPDATPTTNGQSSQNGYVYQPPPYDPLFPNLPAQSHSTSTSPTVDPVFSPPPARERNSSATASAGDVSPRHVLSDRERNQDQNQGYSREQNQEQNREQRREQATPPVFTPAKDFEAKERTATASPAFPAHLREPAGDRKPSTAQAKYTPANYTPENYAPSPKLQPQSPWSSYNPSDDRFRSPPPGQQQQWGAPPPVQAYYPTPIPMPVAPEPQQPMYPVYPMYPTRGVGYASPGGQQDYPYGRPYSPRDDRDGRDYSPSPERDYSPRRSRRNDYSPSPSPERRHHRKDDYSPSPPPEQRQRSKGRSQEKDNDYDRSAAGQIHSRTEHVKDVVNRSKNGQIKDVLKEHRDIGAAALGALAGGFIGHEVGHGRSMTTVLGAALGGFGANLAEKRWEEGNKNKHKRQYDEQVNGRRHYDGYDSE